MSKKETSHFSGLRRVGIKVPRLCFDEQSNEGEVSNGYYNHQCGFGKVGVFDLCGRRQRPGCEAQVTAARRVWAMAVAAAGGNGGGHGSV